MADRARNKEKLLLDQVTVVIPALNEAATIGQLVAEARSLVSEVIVVAGDCKDNTVAVAEAAGARVIKDHGFGKGDALRCAIPEIKTDIAVFIDADRSHDPADIPRLVDPILNGRLDHVTGSRLLGGSSELHGTFSEFLRLSGNSFIAACINARFKVQISDSQNGFRAIRTAVLRQLSLSSNSTTIEQELIIETLKKGFRLGEIPTHEYRRLYGQSHIKVSKTWYKYLWHAFYNLST